LRRTAFPYFVLSYRVKPTLGPTCADFVAIQRYRSHSKIIRQIAAKSLKNE
jgi:hypothetical protein